jgi:ribose transport system permease protein
VPAPTRTVSEHGLLHRRQWANFGLPLATLVMVIVYSIVSPDFLTPTNLLNLARQASPLMILACGEAFVILAGGFDLSIGSTVGLTSVVLALVMLQHGQAAATAAALLVGLVVGIANGVLVVKTHVSTFIVTLAMLSIGASLALTLTGGATVQNLPVSIAYIGYNSWGPLPIPLALAALVVVSGWVVLKWTRLGIQIYALGGNREAARLAGLRVDVLQIVVFAISGFCASVAGVILTSRVVTGQPTLGVGMELQAIAAVILGGVSLFGGAGSILGVVVGVIFIVVLDNGLILLGISSYTQGLVTGVALIAAVTLDRLLVRGTE